MRAVLPPPPLLVVLNGTTASSQQMVVSQQFTALFYASPTRNYGTVGVRRSGKGRITVF
ncbi:hypothetical protein KIN20_013801 [Parelaphostrongylus tenuis]|uniref:Uncharacterized protein n=1 Tax=Parelaphostrongylus tenuis TaxID=148309 RepID=A0AAD5QMU7_PARTN|nr:hypothetical protein KIN20_013801 [Parelaphostrongylus tenuis]